MAKIKKGDKEVSVNDGDMITKACEELGVLFSCYEGECGVCKVKVTQGAENLSEMTDAEKNHHMEAGERLACQCKVKSGDVVITDP
jgi:ferredoxin